jgi:DNA (cytosine-5)-methyltransferase 1
MTAYYNEFDPYAAAWIRNLINAGRDESGVVDERSIEDVRPDDLDGFTQCHFFAGLGGWSYALRLAGWSDHRSVWTASCPCQPYSAAGEGGGFADERHLWPHFEWLVRNQKRRPERIFGEQVASKFAEPWVDLVHADLEALGYAFGCIPFPSASVGAPHIRDRLYWMADAADIGQHGWGSGVAGDGRDEARVQLERLRAVGRMADAHNAGLEGRRESERQRGDQQLARQGGLAGRLADAYGGDACAEGLQRGRQYGQQSQDGGLSDASSAAGPTNGFWRAADWLACRDGKWRPVEPGTFPLVNGAPARMGRLRAYGNAINVEQARIFIQTAMSVLG